ncbi:MAG: hypothetical protein AAFX04_14490 [Pseudomonadota bacterium]
MGKGCAAIAITKDKMMASFLKSDMIRNFVMGFAIGAAALFALQPHETRAEIAQDIASVYTDVQQRLS